MMVIALPSYDQYVVLVCRLILETVNNKTKSNYSPRYTGIYTHTHTNTAATYLIASVGVSHEQRGDNLLRVYAELLLELEGALYSTEL